MGTIRELHTRRGRPLVMGIVNVTPDSFYPGSRTPRTESAVERAARLVEEGANLVDVGGESTRPGSDPVPEPEELDRVQPVVETLADKLDVPVSVDTRRASVAEAALEVGASIVNDTSAGRDDDRMFEVVAEHGADVVLMHRQGDPEVMQEAPSYDDAVGEVTAFLLDRAETAVEAGVDRDAITLDVGVGFGKRLEHNLALIRATGSLAELGYPVLLGVSRKSMFGQLLDRDADERLAGSLAAAVWAGSRGASVLRVHDVRETVDALRTVQAIEEGP